MCGKCEAVYKEKTIAVASWTNCYANSQEAGEVCDVFAAVAA